MLNIMNAVLIPTRTSIKKRTMYLEIFVNLSLARAQMIPASMSIAIKVAVRIGLARVVPEELLFATIRNAIGISATAMSSPFDRPLTFLRPIPASMKTSASRQMIRAEFIMGFAPKMLITSFTNEEQHVA